MYTITKADPSNLEYVGRSVGNKQEILASPSKVDFVCFSQGDIGFVRGFYLGDSVDFQPLDYFQNEVGFTSMFYKTRNGAWQEL